MNDQNRMVERKSDTGHHPEKQEGHVRGDPPKGHMPVEVESDIVLKMPPPNSSYPVKIVKKEVCDEMDELHDLMNAVDPHSVDFDDGMDFDAWADDCIDRDDFYVSDPGPDSRERPANDDERQSIIQEQWTALSNFEKWHACFKYGRH